MYILVFLSMHYVSSVFFQSFFLHRYSTHHQFSMSRGWERFFHLMTFLCMGPSYMPPWAYAAMHRMHHRFADTERDPHTPHAAEFSHGRLQRSRWWFLEARTLFRAFADPSSGVSPDLEFVSQSDPVWHAIDLRYYHLRRFRAIWILACAGCYIPFVTTCRQCVLIFCAVVIHVYMGRLQGLALNWWAHCYGYRTIPNRGADRSRNINPWGLLFGGEDLHLNHHRFPRRRNFALQWFEIDPIYHILRFFRTLKIIRFEHVYR